MGRIQVLDDQLVNRIAAGEVVERPASVVKELLENSLDASARRIEITVGSGGRQLIRVADDGEGMDRDDALLALERHATSKLGSGRDLEGIATLGFRGEALPSIAAVSRFLLRTAPGDGRGTEIDVRGGRIQAVREIGAPRGTSVEAASLFFNVPARRKFLKSQATELAHITRLVTRYALVRPDLRLRLDHDGKNLVDLPVASDRGERIEQIHGPEFRRKVLPFEATRDGLALRGFAGRPVDTSPRRDAQHLFVNGRLVQDRVLAHAITEAYGNTVPRDRFPAVFLFVEIDPRQVDVNVHPQKNEVRFARAGEVHDAVRDALAGALAHEAAVPTYGQLRPSWEGTAPVARAALRYLEVREGAAEPSRVPVAPASLLEGAEGEAAERPRAVPLAQYRDSYIIAQDDEGLLLVDQHAAHERVLFERYLAAAEENRVEVQRLLFPVTLDLPPHERVVLEEEAAELARLGFCVDPFGGSSVRIDGVPALASDLDPGGLLRELLGEAARTRAAAAGIEQLRRRLVTTAACQAAIKIHHPLNAESMQGLLDDLFRASNPTTCPHGRPVLFRFTLEEIERTFRRR